jgi:hypothetical protein
MNVVHNLIEILNLNHGVQTIRVFSGIREALTTVRANEHECSNPDLS